MILRRLAQSLKEQNWTAITIEFVLLVLGVFFGIQAANWNEARQTGEKSGVFSVRLKDDLRREAQRYLFLQEYYRDVQAATEASANALTGKLPLSNEALLINAYRATQYRTSPSFRTTYDELIATGNLGLIEDRAMLNLAIAVYRLSSLELLERDSIASRYRVLFREGIPHDVQRTLASQCGDRFIEIDGKLDRDHVIDYPCTTELPAEDIDAAANALRADPKILRQLSKRVVDLDSHLANLAANMRSTFERNAEFFGGSAMILRRLAQSLKEQNWTAITIEFVLLVLGVFLGIQAANWNAVRQEHALEAEYIARLQRDFTAIEARLVINITRWEDNAAAPVRLINDLDAFRQIGTWPRAKAELLRDLDATMGSRIPASRAASYVELLSAGRLGLLRDIRLRDALADYDTQAGYTMKAYDVLVQRVDPQRPTLMRHMRFDRGADAAQMNPEEILRNGGEPWADVDLVQLGSDPGLETALNTFASASHGQVLNVRLQQGKAKAVITLLEAYAKRSEGKQP